MTEFSGYSYDSHAETGRRLVRTMDVVIVLIAIGALGLGGYGIEQSARSTSEFADIGVFIGLVFAVWPTVILTAYGVAALCERRVPQVAGPVRVVGRVVFGFGALVFADFAGWLPAGMGSAFGQLLSWALGGL